MLEGDLGQSLGVPAASVGGRAGRGKTVGVEGDLDSSLTRLILQRRMRK